MKFRSKKGCILPYVELSLQKDFLQGVTIGPLIEATAAKRSLAFFLRTRGYSPNPNEDYIRFSSIPIRY